MSVFQIHSQGFGQLEDIAEDTGPRFYVMGLNLKAYGREASFLSYNPASVHDTQLDLRQYNLNFRTILASAKKTIFKWSIEGQKKSY